MLKLNGNETALASGSKKLLKIGKYGVYRIYLKTKSPIFILDHEPKAVYVTGLKRLNNKTFICIGLYSD